MTETEPLFDQFCAALNADLATLGCTIRIVPRQPFRPQHMLIADSRGEVLGWVPDHIDAAALAAFERILQRERSGRRQGCG